jgi:hypothetical protein
MRFNFRQIYLNPIPFLQKKSDKNSPTSSCGPIFEPVLGSILRSICLISLPLFLTISLPISSGEAAYYTNGYGPQNCKSLFQKSHKSDVARHSNGSAAVAAKADPSHHQNGHHAGSLARSSAETGFRDSKPVEAVVADLLARSGRPVFFRTGLKRLWAEGLGPDARFTSNAKDIELKQPIYFQIYPDRRTPELFSLENLESNKQIPHEIRTARDYAKFAINRLGARFVFVASLNGSAIPVFDGLLVHPESGIPLANVSLKYASLNLGGAGRDVLLKDIDHRLDLRNEKRSFREPIRWFQVNSGSHVDGNLVEMLKYDIDIKRASFLVNIFGLFGSPSEGAERRPGPRPFNLVVDMRNHGYPFELVRTPAYLNAINELVSVRQNPDTGLRENGPLQLTLIWDANHVIEFKDFQAQIFDLGEK